MANTNLSRLDQVFALLENGASSIARKAAAKQLGNVQEKHPTELNVLLAKLLPYIRHTEWETRLAAVTAVEALVENVPSWQIEHALISSDKQEEDTLLKFDKFDVDKLLSCSETLLGSSGEDMNLLTDPKDHLQQVKHQRKRLETSLGLHSGNVLSLGISSINLFKDDDLVVKDNQPKRTSCLKQASVVMNTMFENMSSREKNVAKRRAKAHLKQKTREGRVKEDKDQPARKKVKMETKGSLLEDTIPIEDIPKHSPFQEEWTRWPFKWFYEHLLDLLFNSAWESRHGACMTIRDLLRKHAYSLGMSTELTREENHIAHQSALEDLAIRLLSVISLDRFADYISDQVVAPVRESCAQALSIVILHMDPKQTFKVVELVLYLRRKAEWQLRQSSMVTLKYIIAVRRDIISELLPMCLDDMMQGLLDSDGDVKSVTAKALQPTTSFLLDHYKQFVRKILVILWDSLLDYDELTASTHSVMLLLSNFISKLPNNRIRGQSNKETETLIKRLWPFFFHVDTEVRKAAISTFLTVLQASTSEISSWRDETSIGSLLSLFSSCMLERSSDIQEQIVKTFLTFLRSSSKSSILQTSGFIRTLLMSASQAVNVAYENSLLQELSSAIADGKCLKIDLQHFIGGCNLNSTNQQALNHIMKTRFHLTSIIGALTWHYYAKNADVISSEKTITEFEELICAYLTSQTSLFQIVGANTLKGFWKETFYQQKTSFSFNSVIFTSIENVLNQNIYYSEISANIIEIQADIQSFIKSLVDHGFNEKTCLKSAFTLDEIISYCSKVDPQFLASVDDKHKKDILLQKDFLITSAEDLEDKCASLDNQAKSNASAVIIQAASCTSCPHKWSLPQKLNSIIRPLMDTLKREENQTSVEAASTSISMLIGLCRDRSPSPNPKLIRNLALTLTSLQSLFPAPHHISSEFSDTLLQSFGMTSESVARDGIVTLLRQRSSHEATKRCRSKSFPATNSLSKSTASENAALCLRKICSSYKEDIFQVVPSILEIIENLKNVDLHKTVDDEKENKLIRQSLAVLQVIFSSLQNRHLLDQILQILPRIISCLYHPLSNIRFISSNCLAELANHSPSKVLPCIFEEVLPQLDSDDFVKRKGSMEVLSKIVDKMGINVVNYAVLLVVPLLGKMGDFEAQTRLLATSCFAGLIQYIPVESSIPDPTNMPIDLVMKKRHERRFLEQLFDSKSLEEYPVPITIKAKLRGYQQDGVKWLAFLNRYKLHGILCDDMGLGKTLQTICIIASDHFYKSKKENDKLVSLVICPPTLTGHWVEETKRFCDHLDPLHYTGVPVERTKLQNEVKHHNLVIASYEVVRNDISFFSKIKWNYCVLDEGHVIRNGKSKTSQSVKTLIANHRLILTGTPIQNNVLELWSLFDFLIPGFLGSEHEFTVRYTKPILASRDAKSSSKEQEMGLVAINALHKQVLPFMLRRMKEDVLKDLPPKIVQDYYCDLSPLQLELYEDFAKSKAKKVAESSIINFDDDIDRNSSANKASHVFQALQYLQKVCNHPAFVLTPNHPEYLRISSKLKDSNNSLKDIKNASKLTALKQLLLDCGIGAETSLSTSIVSQHRALIFCQHRNMLDVIENDLFRPLMTSITYLRLDGSVPASQRFSTVSKFNNDPSIDVLLLSTKVGGLGLNLTGADTVIFVEHDWNPTTDLQAMDRAHRIGQKKVVNVYRIITRGTLEEKILGLQKFKLNLANTIVSSDNRALSSMGTSQVLDLFNIGKDQVMTRRKKTELSNKGLRAMVEGLSDLWDQSQYTEQYDLDNFIKSMI